MSRLLIVDRADIAPFVRPMLYDWRQLREQISTFDKAVRTLVKSDPICRRLMSVPGIGVLSVLAYVSTGGGSGPLRPLKIGRRAHRAHAEIISVRRDGSCRKYIEVWRHAGQDVDV